GRALADAARAAPAGAAIDGRKAASAILWRVHCEIVDMFRSLSLSLILTVTPLAVHAAAPADLPNVSFPAPHRVASGRLQADDVAALQRAGIKQVIDLSVDSETPRF